MSSLQGRLVNYFKNCFEADNRELNLWNVFHRNHEHLYVIEKEEELLCEFLPRIPLPAEYASDLNKAVALYKREKQLIYSAFFVVGKIDDELTSKARKICAPLVYYQAHLEQQSGDWYVSIDKNSPFVNFPLIKELQVSDAAEKDIDIFKQAITGTTVGRIDEWVASVNSDIQTTDLFRFPRLTSEETIRGKLNATRTDRFEMFSSAALLLVKKSLSSRGILHDLDEIARQQAFSNPLRKLFNLPLQIGTPGQAAEPDNVPGILSQAQKKVLHNACRYPLSMVVGPPGTGKSYTIAAIALERYIKGESVIIVSQNEHAVDVVHEKLINHLNVQDSALRAGKQDYHKQLKQYLDNITSGIFSIDSAMAVVSKKQVVAQQRLINKAEKRFLRRCRKLIKQGEFLSDTGIRDSYNPFARLRRYLIKRDIFNSQSLHAKLKHIQVLNRQREKLLSDYIDFSYQVRLKATLDKHRKQLLFFSKAVRARTSSKQDEYFSNVDYRLLLRAFPIWLVSLGSIHKVLPLVAELFDLVIIDEATQCDIASALPALYRAKRAVVIGDPKQLRHVSFLSRDRQRQLQKKYELLNSDTPLDYRASSILDVVNMTVESQQNVVMLDEHYRSKPPIIDFSNKQFYNQALRIMTEKPEIDVNNSLEVIRCEGERKNGVNKVEAQVLLDKLQAILSQQGAELDDYFISIGVLSPFRDQVEHLQKQIEKRIPFDAIVNHKIKVGTPYAFQGEERDIMLISFCVDGQSSASAYRYMGREDVFNVSITRAREKQILFLSVVPRQLKTNTLLHTYIHSLLKQSEQKAHDDRAHGVAQNEVCDLLQAHGYATWKNFSIAGMPMDIVVKNGDRIAALDLVGFPSEINDHYHIERYKLYERAGLPIFPLSYGAWLYQRQRFIEEFKRFLT